MSLLTRRTPESEPLTIAVGSAETDPAEYVVAAVDDITGRLRHLTHPTLMTRGEALFELVKWEHSDSTRKHVLCQVTVVE